MDIRELCFSLAEKAGTSGDETSAAAYAKELLSEYMPVTVNTLGSVVGVKEGEGTHVMLDAHLDQIGLVVRGIDEKGFLLVDKVGGPDPRVLVGAEVTVHGDRELFGVVSSVPPHLQKGDSKEELIEIKNLSIDIGMSKQAAESLVHIGDRITMRMPQCELLGDRIVSAAFDDRAGVAVILRALEMTKGMLNKTKLTVVFSSMEEVGGQGAKTSAFEAMPDYAFAVDVGFGEDPYTDKTQTINLGGGASIGISPTLDKEFTKELIAICKEKDIPYQHDVMGGRTGTNADSINITGKGVKTTVLSIPLRYMHTGSEIISLADIENTAKLIAAYLLKKEDEANA